MLWPIQNSRKPRAESGCHNGNRRRRCIELGFNALDSSRAAVNFPLLNKVPDPTFVRSFIQKAETTGAIMRFVGEEVCFREICFSSLSYFISNSPGRFRFD